MYCILENKADNYIVNLVFRVLDGLKTNKRITTAIAVTTITPKTTKKMVHPRQPQDDVLA